MYHLSPYHTKAPLTAYQEFTLLRHKLVLALENGAAHKNGKRLQGVTIDAHNKSIVLKVRETLIDSFGKAMEMTTSHFYFDMGDEDARIKLAFLMDDLGIL